MYIVVVMVVVVVGGNAVYFELSSASGGLTDTREEKPKARVPCDSGRTVGRGR